MQVYKNHQIFFLVETSISFINYVLIIGVDPLDIMKCHFCRNVNTKENEKQVFYLDSSSIDNN
jgi:hypothetical protein